MKKFLTVIAAFMFVAAIFTACGGQKDRNIQLIRNGTMNAQPNIPIGKAFDQFFSNGAWKSFTSKNNEQIVEFNGECFFLDEKIPMRIQFTVLSDDSFSLSYLGMDGVDIPSDVRMDILSRILEKYQP